MDDSLLRRLRQSAAPTPALDHPSPTKGQLWRAFWRTGDQEAACLVLIADDAVDGIRYVDVVPAGDTEVGDDGAVLVETEDGFRASAWTGIRHRIYKSALDHRIGDLTAASAARFRAVLDGGDSGDWPPIFSLLDDRSLERADLQDRLEFFASADWTTNDDQTGQTVDDLATAADIQNSAIADALHITPGEAQRLRRGIRPARQEELPALTELLGATPKLTIDLDEHLVAQLDEPELRPLLRRRADETHDGDEIAARRLVAERVMATSFRQQTPETRNWKQAILDVLAED